jgi:hypothetical protein
METYMNSDEYEEYLKISDEVSTMSRAASHGEPSTAEIDRACGKYGITVVRAYETGRLVYVGRRARKIDIGYYAVEITWPDGYGIYPTYREFLKRPVAAE